MSALQMTAIFLCFTIPSLAWVMLFRQVYTFSKVFRMGTTDPTRTDRPATRTWVVVKEFLGHTRMAPLPVVAIAHWFTALSFFLLFATLVNAFFQLIWPEFRLPIIGHFAPFEWLIEVYAFGGLIGILVLIAIRQVNHPRRAKGVHGRDSRFFGSTWWQAYYVEATILGVTICILLLRTLEARMVAVNEPDAVLWHHFPLTFWGANVWGYLALPMVYEAIYIFAMLKILISFAWMITISLQPTMGVAWHRFLVFFNIWFKRESSGRTALGNLRPILTDAGTPMTLQDFEAMGEGEDAAEPRLGAGKIEDFSWKSLLDFTTCTECGRCQSQCPAWNTEKPLSPKLVVMTLRDHAHAKAPWVLASEDRRHDEPKHIKRLEEIPLIGDTGYELAYPLGAYDALGPDAIIDDDALWACTTCGACVEQCPVDIEHVDTIVDMRRHRVLIESAFPGELGGLFKNLEGKGNPWGMANKIRLDWANGLPFDVPLVGGGRECDVESLSAVDYLFWVGCAGAFEDRAKKTTRAVAELLHTAGVSFAVLGEGESCTGDSARRAGNEILFQAMAAKNIEVLNDSQATKIVVTCPHCLNTLKNEYPQFGGSYEVIHHTQLLNRLVKERKLVPVSRPEVASTAGAASTGSLVTYHDPCYLGRHNHVYNPPRELLHALPGVGYREMERSKTRSFCCGAGGARMWMEERLGSRINANRTAEAVATGADRIAIGCPFCRVMLSDGLNAQKEEGSAKAAVEVVDIAQMLLASVRAPVEPTPVAAPVAAPTVLPIEATPPTPLAEAAAAEVLAAPAPDASQDAPAARSTDEPVAQPTPTESTPVPVEETVRVEEAVSVKESASVKEAVSVDDPAPTVPPVQRPDAAEASAASAATPTIPTGKMTASEALALMGGAKESAPAAADDEVRADAPAVPAPTATAPQVPSPTPAPVAATPPPAAAKASVAGAAAWATLTEALGDRRTMPASEAMELLGVQTSAAPAATAQAPASAVAQAPAAETVPEPAAAAAAADTAQAQTQTPAAPAPIEVPASLGAPAPAQSPAAPAPVSAAPAAAAAPAAIADSAAWGKLREALGERRTMPASEAMASLATMPVGSAAPAAAAPVAAEPAPVTTVPAPVAAAP
ncbi:MAG: heterodisulfide reductase-related iron-sulfur binding cluster, partial [Dermatophilaceae bacterium]